MAVTKGKLTLADNSEHQLIVTAGDKIRARKEAGGADADEVMLRGAYLAAKRTGLTTVTDFFEWADTVLDFEPFVSERQIAELVAVGELTAEQGEQMRTLYGYTDAEGEGSPTPTSSPASLSSPDSP